MINKKAISVTLQPENVTWLRGHADAAGCKSVSELIDHLVTAARVGGRTAPPASVVGTVTIDPADPDLDRADAEIRLLFETSLNGRRAKRSRRSHSKDRRSA
jgi:hypothetical protein